MRGVDVLDLSPSSIDAPGDRAAPFNDVGVPVIAVNELDQVERALEVLNAGAGRPRRRGARPDRRPGLADQGARGAVRDEIVKCIRCDVKCFGNLRKGIPIECTQWG